jgi:hypothetical protein
MVGRTASIDLRKKIICSIFAVGKEKGYECLASCYLCDLGQMKRRNKTYIFLLVLHFWYRYKRRIELVTNCIVQYILRD